MSRFLFLLSLIGSFLLLSFSVPEVSWTTPTDSITKPFDLCAADNSAFQVGEEITYKLYYNWNFIWLSAGEVTFRVFSDPEGYRLEAKGRTYSSYEWFFKVRDTYTAVVDRETLQPIRTIRDIQEGGYRLYEKVEYRDGTREAISWRKRQDWEPTEETYNLSGCTHDVLSAIYYARNQDYDRIQPGTAFPLRIFIDREELNLQVKYIGKKKRVNVRGQGKFKAIHFSPETVAGTVFSEGAEMHVYASDDRNRLPLLIESPVAVGSVKAILKSHKGLRYPLTAKAN